MSSPRPSPPVGESSSSSSKLWAGTPRIFTGSGCRPAVPHQLMDTSSMPSRAARQSWQPYASTSRPAPGSCSLPARLGSARRSWPQRRWFEPRLTSSSRPGSCLPLSSEAPLMPMADAFRSVYEFDGGQWLGEALSQCSPYVADSLSLLVPELAQADVPAVSSRDQWTGHRLFSAIEATLRTLGSGAHRIGLLIEDLHWGDTTTLEVIEHLAARRPGMPMLGTWRLDDPTIRQTEPGMVHPDSARVVRDYPSARRTQPC